MAQGERVRAGPPVGGDIRSSTRRTEPEEGWTRTLPLRGAGSRRRETVREWKIPPPLRIGKRVTSRGLPEALRDSHRRPSGLAVVRRLWRFGRANYSF